MSFLASQYFDFFSVNTCLIFHALFVLDTLVTKIFHELFA